MRRYYPYLEDPQVQNANQLDETRGFLAKIDEFVNQKQYVRMTLLDWDENPLKEIQGEIVSGSITKDGSSSVRRSCNLSTVVSGSEYDPEDAKMDFSLNKKIFIEIGVKNYTDQYPDYPILWFPQGVFFLSSFSINSSASSTVNIQLQLKDKMCGLNGYCGGLFQSAIILDSVDTQSADGKYIQEKVPIYNIIQELVNHYGGEPLENILIEDVPLKIKRVVKWMGENPLWVVQKQSSDGYMSYRAYTEKPEQKVAEGEEPDPVTEYDQNEDCGYVYDDFVYSDDLTCNLGDSVATALDKIKSYLGNYEYYYDVFGVFHFREIKNYLNTTYSTALLADMSAKNYLVDITSGRTVYTFSDKSNIISITNNPKYDNIKNDYIIQGEREGTSTNQKITIMYHLAIDKKPKPGTKFYNLVIYRETATNLTRVAFPLSFDTFDDLPTPGNFNLIYRTKDDNKFYQWDDMYKEVECIKYYAEQNTADKFPTGVENVSTNGYETVDWRTELYLRGLLARNNGTDSGYAYSRMTLLTARQTKGWLSNLYYKEASSRLDVDYYFEELDAYWPQIYDLEHQIFQGDMNQGLQAEVLNRYNTAKANTKLSEDRLAKQNEDRKKAIASYDEMAKLIATDTTTLSTMQEQAVQLQTDIDAAKASRSDDNATTVDTEIAQKQLQLDALTIGNDGINLLLQKIANENNELKKRQERVDEANNNYSLIEQELRACQDTEKNAKTEYDKSENKRQYAWKWLVDGNYYLDFIDPQTSELGEFSIQNIGRRTDAVADSDVNCLFTPIIPDIVWINVDDTNSDEELRARQKECNAIGQAWSQVHNDIYQYFYTGGYKNGAYDRIKSELWTHTTFQNSLSITAIPVFYLEPNTRVMVNDVSTNTYGEYMVKNISLPLGAGQTMNVSCNRCLQKM